MSALRYIWIGLSWLFSVLLIAPVVLCGLLVQAITIAVRNLARRLEPSYRTWRQLMEFDSELGWRPKGNLDTYYIVKRDDVHHIQTDAEGWSGVDSLGDEHEMVVIGDSYAFGFGIDTGSSFAGLTTSPRIKAIGTNGYSMVQGVILMRQLAQRLTGKVVVWFVYLENDLYDNLFPAVFSYRAPFVRNRHGSDEWEIVTDHITPDRWEASARVRQNMDVLAELCTPNPLSDRVFSACRYLVEEANEACRRSGARLIVLTIPNPVQLDPQDLEKLARRASQPDKFDTRYPEMRIAEICRDLEVQYVAGSAHLEREDYKRWERFHWNARGHAKVAQLLSTLYQSSSQDSGPAQAFVPDPDVVASDIS